MGLREITIQTYVLKKGKYDRRSFNCQLITVNNTRTYLLDNTKNDLLLKHFTLAPGNRVFDGDKTYYIKEIWYWPRPKFVLIAV